MAAPTQENGDVMIFDAQGETTDRKVSARKIHITGGGTAGAVKLTDGDSNVVFDGRIAADGNVDLNFDSRGFYLPGLTATTLVSGAKVMVYV